MFSCEYCKTFKNHSFIEHLWWFHLRVILIDNSVCFIFSWKQTSFWWKKIWFFTVHPKAEIFANFRKEPISWIFNFPCEKVKTRNHVTKFSSFTKVAVFTEFFSLIIFNWCHRKNVNWCYFVVTSYVDLLLHQIWIWLSH